MAEPRFVVFTRGGCALCDEFIHELRALLEPAGIALGIRDVDGDAVSLRRYGLKVPVLTCDGSMVCHGRLDAGEVTRLLRR